MFQDPSTKLSRTLSLLHTLRGVVAQWVGRLTRDRSVVCSNPIKGFRCFLEQRTLTSLLCTGWFQERMRAISQLI